MTGQYEIKCDDCKTTMGHTDSMRESACGGLCESCRPTGSLYRREDGVEVWRIVSADGATIISDIESDSDIEWLLSHNAQRVRTIYGETGQVVGAWGEIMRTVRLDNGRTRQFHHTKIHPAA